MSNVINKVAVWEKDDGTISITHFSILDILDNETEDQLIERMIKKISSHPPFRGKTPNIISRSDIIPQTKEDRDEWVFKNSKVMVDQVKVQAKLDVIVLKDSKKQVVLSKLGITEQELKDVLGK